MNLRFEFAIAYVHKTINQTFLQIMYSPQINQSQNKRTEPTKESSIKKRVIKRQPII